MLGLENQHKKRFLVQRHIVFLENVAMDYSFTARMIPQVTQLVKIIDAENWRQKTSSESTGSKSPEYEFILISFNSN